MNDDENTGPRKWDQIRAIFKYEFLWNLRKKKVLALFLITAGLTSVNLFLPYFLGSEGPNPLFSIRNLGPNAFIMVLLAVAVSMNSISGEFEGNTITPLASKPISRKTIYLGKLLAIMAILLIVYTALNAYFLIGSWIIYGAQTGLGLAVVGLPFLATLSTAVWVSATLALGSGFKSSTMAAIGTVGLFFAVSIASGMVSVMSPGSGQALNYLPGGGVSGQVSGNIGGTQAENLSVSMSTNDLPQTFLLYMNDSSAKVTVKYHRLNLENLENNPGSSPLEDIGSKTYSLSQAFGRSLLVALVYVFSLNLLSLWLFERSEPQP